MNFEEFLQPRSEADQAEKVSAAATAEEAADELQQVGELDIQKAVVESLAADKAVMDEKLASAEAQLAAIEKELAAEKEAKERQIAALEGEIANLKAALAEAKKGIEPLEKELEALKAKNAEQAAELAKTGDILAANADGVESNKIALLDRETEIADRFPGETRDHVLEVIKEARDRAEAEGRVRRAQLLESVLVANEPNGGLSKKRVALEKFFNDNGNILTGQVIDELERCGISYKKGEEYLLPAEILRRTY